jgi:hypothetical protein
MQVAGPDKSLNGGLIGCTAIPSTSSPTLPHGSFARGTQGPPTVGSSLDLGLRVAGWSGTRAGQDNNKLLEGPKWRTRGGGSEWEPIKILLQELDL